VKILRKPLLIAFTALAAILTGAWLTQIYRGQSKDRLLSEYLDLAGRDDAGSERARNTLCAMSGNAVPTLLRWLRYGDPEPNWRRRLVLKALPQRFWNRGPILILSGVADGDKVYRAVNGFAILGTNAILAIPELITLSKDTNHPNAAFYAINSLSLLGPAAYPYMQAGLNNTNHPYRALFARNLPNFTQFVAPEVCMGTLGRALSDRDRFVREAAATALMELACQTNLGAKQAIQRQQVNHNKELDKAPRF